MHFLVEFFVEFLVEFLLVVLLYTLDFYLGTPDFYVLIDLSKLFAIVVLFKVLLDFKHDFFFSLLSLSSTFYLLLLS